MDSPLSALPCLTEAKVRSPLAPDFVPAVLWNRAYRDLTRSSPGPREVTLTLYQGTQVIHSHRLTVLAANHPAAALSFRYVERLLKFLLWQRGANRVAICGADELAAKLNASYGPAGERAFDATFMGEKVYGAPFRIEGTNEVPSIPAATASAKIGRHLDGCRIGFDLGGSDRKAAALIDGRVVYSEEIPWDPYFQIDPAYHLEGVQDSLRRAAAHLPRIDAIGGSAAGVYVNNEVRVASLFRGLSPALFDLTIKRMFFTLQERWSGIPFVVVNDGEVTALAGSMALGANAVLGVSMGTSQAGGYVTPEGNLTPWLNELAFAPIDYASSAPVDEWSGDAGCGVQYFSQQGVVRLARAAGLNPSSSQPLAEQLVAVQDALSAGRPEATAVFEAVGIAFGYAVAHYAEFYELKHVLVLGRVTSGAAGEIILRKARLVLEMEFPEVAHTVVLSLPDEKSRRHGQAIAAASLPQIKP